MSIFIWKYIWNVGYGFVVQPAIRKTPNIGPNLGLTIPNVEIQIRRKYADPQLKKKENLLLLDHALVHVGDLLLH